jgi:hypothetical protein
MPPLHVQPHMLCSTALKEASTLKSVPTVTISKVISSRALNAQPANTAGLPLITQTMVKRVIVTSLQDICAVQVHSLPNP